MGDVVSSHLDERKREMVTGRTRQVMRDFQTIFEQQYSVALFNSVRAEIEGVGGTHAQLLHRKDPLAGRTIFSGSLLQHVEENRKWKNRYVSIPNSYSVDLYESKTACDRSLQPKVSINCAGYKVLTSLEEYLELINQSLPGVEAKAGAAPFIKTPTLYPLVLWHPYARHHYFCVLTEKEHSKWSAVLRDCVRHANNGLPEESPVQTPAFTNSVRLYRQAQGHYGSWDMMCGTPPEILSNLVMEELQPDLRSAIGPRLKGKLQQRQRSWMLISAAVYRQVLNQATSQYEALLSGCEAQRDPLDADLRTNMDQIITSKEHVSSKIKATVLPRAEQLLRDSVRPYVSSILEALMEPTSRGFTEVREVFSRELVELSRNSLDQDQDKLGEHMERVSMLAFHPVKMRPCYEQVERMDLEGLQQRFNVCGPSVFTGRAQILMREQMDNAVNTFEQLLNQSVEPQGEGDVCKSIQRCQDRVLKKFDYDSSTVRKKFFREALLQIIVPYMLQQLEPSCSPELPRFQELIFEDFSRFLLVENLYEEAVIQSVSKDIMSAVKEAAAQRRHNLYRDSIVLSNSDPNLHLLDDTTTADSEFSEEPSDPRSAAHKPSIKGRVSNYSSKRRQIVSMIQLEGVPLPYESCLDVPGEDPIAEEDSASSLEEDFADNVGQIRGLIDPVVEVVLPDEEEEGVEDGTEFATGRVVMEDGMQEEVSHVTTVRDKVPRSSVKIRNEANVQKDDSPTVKTFPRIEEGIEISANIGEEDVSPTMKTFPNIEEGIGIETSANIGEEDGSPTIETFPKIEEISADIGAEDVLPTIKTFPKIEEISAANIGQEDVSPTIKTFPKIEEGIEISAKNIGAEDVSPTIETFPNIEVENEIENADTTPQIETLSEPETKKSPQSLLQQLMGSKRQEEEAAIKRAIHELDIAVQGEEDSDQNPSSGPDSDSDSDPGSAGGPGPITNGLGREADPADVEVVLT